ncbi:transporter substrate-binding domain-containing protein [Marinomonas fungiae]|uniref:Amino acid ABC transporter substrate-binding protein, PAAT family (TC 3.A.1.3.-) n=1 Tax=Marinomonas fungiae TaxID=1137284 RepID=A0A0K6IQT5_9GAMM|nr:transporter substrate-binding domain-containing protein [Marinomonas fungiae]CUB05454.1 amino acid ABC transporter substrate-binding protein, PAAT family (TC 3.A.1.3.-) [Marinomonas fungiae]
MFSQRVQKSLLLSVLFSCHVSAWGQTVTIPVVNFPPYIIISPMENTISGMDIRIVREAFAQRNIDTKFVSRPWLSIMQGMQAGSTLGTVSCSRRPERVSFMLFSDELSTTNRAVISRTELDTHAIESVYDLMDYRVVAVKGWDMEQQLLELNIPHQQISSISDGLNAVINDTSDLFYVSDYPAMYQARLQGIHKQLKVTNIVSEPLVPLHVCFSKKNPEARSLMQEFNQGLQAIKRNGTYQAIRNEYL